MITVSSIIEEYTKNLHGYDAYLVGTIIKDICAYGVQIDTKHLYSAEETLTYLIRHIENDKSPSPKHPNSGMVCLRNFDSEKGGLL